MKKSFISMAIFSAFAITGAQAAPVIGATGTITFEGSITADSCKVTSTGASSSGANMLVSMGPHSAETLGTEANPAVSGGKLSTIAKNIDLNVECASGTKVSLDLKPSARVGKGIAVAGGAQGVQIMLVSDDTVLDFTSGMATVDAPDNGSSTFSIPLTAYYTLQAGKSTADVKAGAAKATVAYTLSYE
ncbi:fimbrial protein [Comamonas sp. GB3 AK4-5]|uniref:fimbrial protein n=1 Tax=Comamonas sp. GB3 AK4-5 TaxID=3231487 RepID=UPI00351E6D3A